jgi:ABC-type multidrug transport system fused ATPase/permease subunit
VPPTVNYNRNVNRIIQRSFGYLNRTEKLTFIALLSGRCVASVLDLAGVVLLGYLGTSVAMFLSQGSDATRTLRVLGFSIATATIQTLPAILALTLVLFLSKAIISIYLTRKLAENLALVEARAAREIAENVLGHGLDQMRTLSKEELLFVTTTGASSAFSGLFNNLATLVSEGFLFLALVGTFFVVDPLTTLLVLFYFSAVAFSIHYFTGNRLAAQSEILVARTLESNRALIDLTEGFRELVVLKQRGKYFDKLEAARRNSSKAIGTQLYLSGMPRYVIETALLVGVLAFAGFKLLSGDLDSSITTLAIFMSGSMRIVAAMLPWQAALVSIRGNAPQAELAHQHLRLTSISNETITISPSRVEPSSMDIEFDEVFFTHKGAQAPTINKLNFKISGPTLLSFIGVSGSGKSTIADLVLGLLAPDSGRITIGGVAPASIIRDFPGLLSYVPQSPGALSGSIRENITLNSDPKFDSKDQLDFAVANSNLRSFIGSLPQGLDTDLGKHADSLSGGQLQRIGLARALYPRPKVLVMDEATSALDAESENQITLALSELKNEMTIIVIAHRLNTIQYSDVVFLVEEGTVLDSGKFAEIADRNPKIAAAIELMSIKTNTA